MLNGQGERVSADGAEHGRGSQNEMGSNSTQNMCGHEGQSVEYQIRGVQAQMSIIGGRASDCRNRKN